MEVICYKKTVTFKTAGPDGRIQLPLEDLCFYIPSKKLLLIKNTGRDEEYYRITTVDEESGLLPEIEALYDGNLPPQDPDISYEKTYSKIARVDLNDTTVLGYLKAAQTHEELERTLFSGLERLIDEE